MDQEKEIKEFKRRWEEVEAFQKELRRSAPIELRWRQLNAAYGMAKTLGWIKPDPSEMDVILRWAMLKEKYTNRRTTI